MAIADKTAGKSEGPEAQIARLRNQVDSLAEDRITPAVTKFTADARRTFSDTATMLRGQLETLSRKVEERPLTSILIATSIGMLIGRVIR
jgi:ElaB/YqjD/DUF883 family membrane-anchored ribosome-binding protein